MNPTAAVATTADTRAKSEEAAALLNAAGATVGALGVVDLLLGITMFGVAPGHDTSFEGAAAAVAMRAYGIRVAFVGAVNIAFVWAAFAEPGARPLWLWLPALLAASDVLFDAVGLVEGAVPWKILAVTTAAHEFLLAAVLSVAVSAWRRERRQALEGQHARR